MSNEVLFMLGEIGIEAKSLGIKTGPQLIFKQLKERGLLKEDNTPKSKYVPHWFVVKPRAKDIADSFKKRGQEVPYSPEIEKAKTTYATMQFRRYILHKMAKEAGITIDESEYKAVTPTLDSVVSDIMLKYSDEENLARLVYRLIRNARLHKSADVYKYVQEALSLYGTTSTAIEYNDLRPVYTHLQKVGYIEKRGANKNEPLWYAIPAKQVRAKQAAAAKQKAKPVAKAKPVVEKEPDLLSMIEAAEKARVTAKPKMETMTEARDRRMARYEQIKGKAKVESLGNEVGRNNYKVISNPENLGYDDLALICDRGNLCFGYRCDEKLGLITVYTD